MKKSREDQLRQRWQRRQQQQLNPAKKVLPQKRDDRSLIDRQRDIIATQTATIQDLREVLQEARMLIAWHREEGALATSRIKELEDRIKELEDTVTPMSKAIIEQEACIAVLRGAVAPVEEMAEPELRRVRSQ